jgi:hypothetical protein
MRPRDPTPLLRNFLIVPLAFMLMAMVGCGKPPLKTIPVSGKVLVGSQPLKTGSINYYPDSSKGNAGKEMAVGSISDAGEYSLGTGKAVGAVPGWYKVTVTATRPGNPKDEYSIPVSLIPERYNAVATTTLSVEVKEGAPTGHYDLKLSK